MISPLRFNKFFILYIVNIRKINLKNSVIHELYKNNVNIRFNTTTERESLSRIHELIDSLRRWDLKAYKGGENLTKDKLENEWTRSCGLGISKIKYHVFVPYKLFLKFQEIVVII